MFYRTQAIIAGAVLNLKYLPNKLNPVIKPLMDAIKKEENECLQVISLETHYLFISVETLRIRI